MTAVLPAPKAHKVGDPVMLTGEQIKQRRHKIEQRYGSAEELRRTRAIIGLSLDQRIALHELENLEFLERGDDR